MPSGLKSEDNMPLHKTKFNISTQILDGGERRKTVDEVVLQNAVAYDSEV
jgi:hypothetical protein